MGYSTLVLGMVYSTLVLGMVYSTIMLKDGLQHSCARDGRQHSCARDGLQHSCARDGLQHSCARDGLHAAYSLTWYKRSGTGLIRSMGARPCTTSSLLPPSLQNLVLARDRDWDLTESGLRAQGPVLHNCVLVHLLSYRLFFIHCCVVLPRNRYSYFPCNFGNLLYFLKQRQFRKPLVLWLFPKVGPITVKRSDNTAADRQLS